MKKVIIKRFIAGGLVLTIAAACSKSFLEKSPLGTLDEATLANRKGVDGLLIGAYSMLDGYGGAGGSFYSPPSNWIFGGVGSDDAFKGSDAGDQAVEINPIETYTTTSTNPAVSNKWPALYDGIQRSNDVLRVMRKATDIGDDSTQIKAEALFLRGFYHFEAKKMWDMVPYVDESISFANNNYNVKNDVDIWPMIINDLQFAYDNLPETQTAVGRATKFAASALLGKVHLFMAKDDPSHYAMAKPYFDFVINSGNFDLINFADNFNAQTEKNSESIFSVQHSVNDGGNGDNGGWGDVLNFPYGNAPVGCCGFYQPTQDLVDAFKTDPVTGLPQLDNWYTTHVTSDRGITSGQPFTPYAGTLDSRLDHTVGRRGIPYMDWGVHPGNDWVRDQAFNGPFTVKKSVIRKSQQDNLTDAAFWSKGTTANNFTVIRYADVLLMAAEVEAQLGNLEDAKDYVNEVRERAADPAGWVKNEAGTGPAANYKVGLYPSFPTKDYALKAIQFERRLELAMEGHRFFDLVRWNIAADVLNAYINREKTVYTHLNNSTFVAGKHEYYPIPQGQIDASVQDGAATLTQNPGY